MKRKEVRIDVFILAIILFGTLLAIFAFAPFLSLESPTDGQQFLDTNSVTFNCSVNDTDTISNISLYHDINGSFTLNQTKRWGEEITDKENGQVLLLHFNNDSSLGENSTYVYDSSGTGNKGTVINVSYNSTGKYGGAFEFSRGFYSGYTKNESIEIADSNSLDLTSAGTVEAWVKPALSSYNWYMLLSKGDNYDDSTPYALWIEKDSGYCYLRVYLANGITTQTISARFAETCNEGIWYHMAVTWDSSIVKIYMNGMLNSTAPQTVIPFDSSDVMRIGKNAIQEYTFYGAVDEIAIYNRTLSAEEIAMHGGYSPLNSTAQWTIPNIPDGNYSWNCLSADNNSESNFSSANKSFLVDVNPPIFSSISINPSTTDDIDPGTQINVSVNITERFDRTVILQYKQASAGTWINKTMINTSANIFEENFTVTPSGNWNYRIYANDSFGHANISSTYNLSAEFDYTWTYSPANFTTISGFFNTNKSIGIITINNTGDFSLNFDLFSDWENTFYNITDPFDLAAKAVKNINVSVKFGGYTREDTVRVTVDAVPTEANPSSATLAGTIVSYAGGPYFDVRIVTYPSEINQSQTTNLSAYVRNLGNQTSTETWLTWALPSGWTNITGNMSLYIGNLSADSTTYNSITANISSSASAGIATITANATCNENISDAESKSVTVSCSNSDGVCGTGCTYLTDSDCTQETITIGGGGGGGGQSAGGGKTIIIEKEEITYSQIVHIVRGEKGKFSISVNNTFEGTTLENVTIDITGFLSQYMSSSPAKMGGIAYGESRDFLVEVSVPNYLTHANYTLTGIIQGNIKYPNKNPKDLLIRQYVLLIVHETSKEQAKEVLETAKNILATLTEKGIPLKKAQKMLAEAENALTADEYETAAKLAEQISNIAARAEESGKLIAAISEGIKNAEYFGLKADETKNILNLAKAAFEREDFETALTRAKEAEVLITLETEGKINIANYIVRNWYYILAALFAFSLASVAGYRQVSISLSAGRLESLAKEESGIAKLMKDAQKKAFENKEITLSDYYREMLHYEERLRKIRINRARLRSRRAGALTLKEEIKSLETESTEVLGLLKKAQENYFEKGNITKSKYEDEKDSVRIRLAEIEEAKALLEARIRERKRQKGENKK